MTARIPCPTVRSEVKTWYAGMAPDAPPMVTYNVPCEGSLRPCPVCLAVRYCGREGRCLDADLGTHVVRRHFVIEEEDYGVTGGVPGWTRGERWNGWACPRFERDAALAIVTAQVRLGGQGEYDAATDTMRIWMDDDPTPDTYAGEVLETPEGPKTVYAIGAWGWIWDTVED